MPTTCPDGSSVQPGEICPEDCPEGESWDDYLVQCVDPSNCPDGTKPFGIDGIACSSCSRWNYSGNDDIKHFDYEIYCNYLNCEGTSTSEYSVNDEQTIFYGTLVCNDQP